MRTVFIIALCVGIALAGQSKIREARKKREFTLSFSQGGSTTCQGDQLTNCASYTKSVCSNPEYSKWVADNCCAYCGVGGVSGGGMPPAPQTTSGFNLVFATNAPQMGGGGSCQDAIPNCASYTSSVCTDPSYSDWVHTNCAHFCNKCGGAGVTNHPVPIMGSTCQDKLPNCASYAADVCTSSSYAQWAKDNCANFCHLCGSTGPMGLTAGPMPIGMMPTSGTMPVSGGMTGGCTDVSSNCAQLNSASHICTDSGALIYAQQNCARTCNMCSGGSQPQSILVVCKCPPLPVPTKCQTVQPMEPVCALIQRILLGCPITAKRSVTNALLEVDLSPWVDLFQLEVAAEEV
ncbi:uncharacterized protein LOC127844535 isoform X2 [Dreissena polymorpha]|uniref:uncharacterized protein LOC127844535 isoform X2 n=1 Tax=Dreissena polymorpha TaxID=45954 RepID=UPI002264C14B|nr:uncharacterized protein LOC127844535 isoform X2 [Dreissena polymorpha]XP_052230826.1 uncharacterized protein LOC127844535 isoform X2 [Dreissena polymorpha]